MPIQQLMIAQRIAGAGGNPPTAYAGLTFWYDADSANVYKTTSTSGGLSTADGDPAERVDSVSPTTRTMAELGPGTLLETNFFGSNRAVHYLTGTQHNLYTKPVGAAAPSVNQAVSQLVSVSNAVIIFAGQVNDAGADTGSPYSNTGLLGDPSGYIGLYCYKTGSNIIFQAYNYSSGTTVVATGAVAVGTPVVVTMKHTGGVLRIRRNGVEIANVASGNTDNLAATPYIGGGLVSEFLVNQLVTYNAARTDAEILLVERYMGARIGVTI